MNMREFALERYFARYEFASRHLLSSSDCQSMSIADLLALEPGAAERFHQVWLGYTESPGAPSLRRRIAALYDGLDPDDVLVHSGAEEAIFLLAHAALRSGDHVVVQHPCYQSLAELPRSLGCRVDLWRGRADQGWRWDLDELESLVGPETSLVIINQPHNPTGHLMSHGEYARLFELAERFGFRVLGDEVYRGLEYDPAARLTPACDMSPRAVSLGVMSKSYGLAGLRIGWVATRDRALYQAMAGLKDYTTICNSAPSEFLAELALGHGEQLVRRNLELIRSNLELAREFFSRRESWLTWQEPQAGPIVFPRVSGGDAEGLCDHLRERAGVLLLPGRLFGPGLEAHFRLGMGRADMPACLELAGTTMRDYF